MEDYLYQKDMWWSLEGNIKKLTIMSDEDWVILDRKALGTHRLCLVPSVAFNISKETITTKLMAALAKLYEKALALNNIFLMECLFNMKMSEGGSVVDHLNKFNTVTNELTSVKVNLMKRLGLS